MPFDSAGRPWHWSWTSRDWPHILSRTLLPVIHWLVGAAICIVAGTGVGFIVAVASSAGVDSISTSIVRKGRPA